LNKLNQYKETQFLVGYSMSGDVQPNLGKMLDNQTTKKGKPFLTSLHITEIIS